MGHENGDGCSQPPPSQNPAYGDGSGDGWEDPLECAVGGGTGDGRGYGDGAGYSFGHDGSGWSFSACVRTGDGVLG